MSGSTSYPFNTVVYITDTIAGQGWQGSGVLLTPDEVLTAAHVVYSSSGGAATNITVTPGYNAGSSTAGSATGTSIHYLPIQDPYDTITKDQSQNDFAIIHLSKPFTGIGTMGLDPNFSGGQAYLSGYPAINGGKLDTVHETFTQDPNYALLDGTAIGQGSSGGPVWITDSNGTPEVVGVVSTLEGDAGSAGYFAQITPTTYNQIEQWVSQDDGGSSATPLTVVNTSKAQTLAAASAQYTGPVSGLQSQYINITTDSLNISTATGNWFINTGSGNDSINVSQGNGNNILDGGGGSNFLTGGAGNDTFYLDDRNLTATAWSTVVNFHHGDAVTLWGITPQDFTTSVFDNQGAANYIGVTIDFSSSGKPVSAVTLAGYTSTDLKNGVLDVSYGSTTGTAGAPGAAYMHIQAG